MKKFLTKSPLAAIAVLAALLFSACTDTEVFSDGTTTTGQQTPENAISFGTYMGRQTRAGSTGSIDTDQLKAAGYGFGVFAYYQQERTYSNFQNLTYGDTKDGTPANQAANFMFNQKVEWKSDAAYTDYVTQWYYTPIKYWPNEIANTADGDDDQEKNVNTNPAFSTQQRGKVSFFAYAPYVDLSGSGIAAEDEGITAINGEKTLAAANVKTGDPTISYKVAADAKNSVDLLWGTYGGTSKNVNDAENAGVAYKAGGTLYEQAILESYKLNADLTKQATNGTVDFAFKHALAKVGGGSVETVTPGASNVNGLMVVLDIDDNKGKEEGGNREEFTYKVGEDDVKAYRTIVTIKTIKISNDLDGGSTAPSNLKIGETTHYGTTLKTDGTFNLATGKWTLGTTNSLVSQSIGTKAESVSDDDNSLYSAELAEALREYHYATADNTGTTYISEASTKTDYFKQTGGRGGVTEKPQNVFQDPKASPLVFIPEQAPVLRFDIDYVVRTYDANLPASQPYTEVEQVVSKIVTLPTVELNKQYNILIHLGLTGVKFTATVSNWDAYKDGDGNTDIDDDGEMDITIQDVYVPRNVQDETDD